MPVPDQPVCIDRGGFFVVSNTATQSQPARPTDGQFFARDCLFKLYEGVAVTASNSAAELRACTDENKDGTTTDAELPRIIKCGSTSSTAWRRRSSRLSRGATCCAAAERRRTCGLS